VLSTALRVAIPVLVFLFNTGLTVSGIVSLPLALISWALMIPVLAIALLWPRISPRLKSWTGIADGDGLTDEQKRAALNRLLGSALEEGQRLSQGRMYRQVEDESGGEEEKRPSAADKYRGEIHGWVYTTYELIEAAFGEAQARRFLSNEGDMGGPYLMTARIERLHELIDRMHSLPINPDFDPQEWTSR
jgi:hypothetical protein